jgi:two-component system chemotaxis response regulator CheV
MESTLGNSKTDILLESGTNELEIVEFFVGRNIYGINVAKVREIIRFPDNVVPVPESHPSIEGIAELRGKVVPIINLPVHLGETGELDKSSSYVIVTEFNQETIGFCVDSVDTIRRLSWSQIESPTGVIASEEGLVVSIVKFDDRMVLLLDFEKISADINPASAIQNTSKRTDEKTEYCLDRSSKTILVAEDSKYILKVIVRKLEKAGYKVRTAPNGLMAWEYLNSIIDDMDNHINILITDIEMPKMDGLHLVKKIKSHEKLKRLPCLVFSSLITEEMILKCKSVGADGQICKAEIEDLAALADSFILSQG